MSSRQTVIEKGKFNVFIIEGNEKLNNGDMYSNCFTTVNHIFTRAVHNGKLDRKTVLKNTQMSSIL